MDAGRSLETAVPDLVLRELVASDAVALHQLVADNIAHLTAHGDYGDLVASSREDLERELSDFSGRQMRFGLLVANALVGRLDLRAVDPPRYSIGYWLAQSATGQGYATAAIKAACRHAQDVLGASDIYAGVTHGNQKSASALERAGFRKIETFERYARFRLSLRAE